MYNRRHTGIKDCTGTEIKEGDIICQFGDRHPSDCGFYMTNRYRDKAKYIYHHFLVSWNQEMLWMEFHRDEDGVPAYRYDVFDNAKIIARYVDDNWEHWYNLLEYHQK